MRANEAQHSGQRVRGAALCALEGDALGAAGIEDNDGADDDGAADAGFEVAVAGAVGCLVGSVAEGAAVGAALATALQMVLPMT